VPDVPDVPLVLHDLAVAIGEVRAALAALASDPRMAYEAATAALAERMGISKTRAAQLVAQAARHGSDLDGRIAAEGGQP
jgi:hypothetical protein